MGDAPVLMKVANPSSQDRTPRRAIVLAVSPAPAPYRASGLVRWHFSDVAGPADDVRCWGQNGPRGQDRRLPKMTHNELWV
jgi:hypothetical protein